MDTHLGTLVREDYFGYPEFESNIYMLNHNGQPVWFAERPLADDAYANPIVELDSFIFKCASWRGFTCELELSSGKIINALFTK